MTQKQLKDICYKLCKFDSNWRFIDDKDESYFQYHSHGHYAACDMWYDLIRSEKRQKAARYKDLLNNVMKFRNWQPQRWDHDKYDNIPEFHSLEELAMKIGLAGYG